MRIERTWDRELVEAIITHPAIYGVISDDGAPDQSECSIPNLNRIYALLVEDGGVGGCYLVWPQNSFTLEIHTCLLPNCRGKKAAKAARLVLDWVFSNTACEKLITQVPAFNRAALIYARRAGLKDEGVNRASFKKDGVMHDQYLLGITRAEACQQ